MVNEISKEQIFDADIVEEPELQSAGVAGSPYITPLTIVSTTAATRIIVFSAGDMIQDRVAVNDLVKINTGLATGTYTVEQVIDEVTVKVFESIVNSLSGTAAIYYPSGGLRVGFNPAGTTLTATDVETAIKQTLSPPGGGNGVTPPFIFSKAGNASPGTRLRVGEAQGGIKIKGSNKVVELQITSAANVGSNTLVKLQRRTALNTYVDIAGATITIPSGQYSKEASMNVSIGPDWEISAIVVSGSTLQEARLSVYVSPA